MDSAKRNIYIIAAIAFVVIIVAVYFLFIFQKDPKAIKTQKTSGEVKQLSEIELGKKPYITLTPTSDGAEIIISIENMANFDRIEYELTYLADNPQVSGEKIQRGSTGTDINTKEAKYKKSILLGTASRGVRSPDKGVIDGKLTMHAFIGDTEYLSETSWNFVQAGSTASTIQDASGKFKLELYLLGKDYWIILAETIGLPPGDKEFKAENVVLPVYGSFSVASKFTRDGKLLITLSNDVKNPQLYAYSNADSKWTKLISNYDDSSKTISATVNSFATFVVVS